MGIIDHFGNLHLPPVLITRNFAPFPSTMRRLLFLAVSFPTLLFAQVRMGPIGGVSLATVNSGQFLAWSGLPKIGPVLGWKFRLPITTHVGLDLEPMFMSKGSWTRNAPTNTNTFVTLRYLELPALIELDLDTIPDGLYLTGGLVYGYWLSGNVRTTQDGSEITNYSYDLSGPNVRRSQWSVAVGLGKQGSKWSWEVRGQSSVTPFDPLLRSHNLVFSLLVGYRLPLPPKREAKEDDGSEN